jgi:hypothetical protein
VLGIPTLIGFLKKIRDSLHESRIFLGDAVGYVDTQQQQQQSHYRPLHHSSQQPFQAVYVLPAAPPQQHQQQNISGVFGNVVPAGGRFGIRTTEHEVNSAENVHRQHTSKVGKQEQNQNEEMSAPGALSPPSRSHSRATIASLGSFSLQQLPRIVVSKSFAGLSQ